MKTVKFLLAAMAAFTLVSCTEGDEPTPQADPEITITTQPSAPGTLAAGEIPANTQLTVAATATEGATVSYQWYENTVASNGDGSRIDGATGASYTLPTSLEGGAHYFFCEVSAEGAEPVRSNVVTVNVTSLAIDAAPLTPFGIVGTNYPHFAAQTATITNTGTETVTLTQPVAGDYIVGTLSTLELAAGETATFTVQPLPALAAGVHDEKISIEGSDGTLTSVAAQLTVKPYVHSPGTELRVGDLIWAGANVGYPEYTFAADASMGGATSFGGYYQFNWEQSWPSFGDVDKDGPYWLKTPGTGSENGWHPNRDPCPEGWRIPTRTEWMALNTACGDNFSFHEMNGHFVTVWHTEDGTGTIYLPVAGYRDDDARRDGVGNSGLYWSSEPSFQAGNGYNLSINVDRNYIEASRYYMPFLYALSIRCVRPAED